MKGPVRGPTAPLARDHHPPNLAHRVVEFRDARVWLRPIDGRESGPGEIRTRGLVNANDAIFQLIYRPTEGATNPARV